MLQQQDAAAAPPALVLVHGAVDDLAGSFTIWQRGRRPRRFLDVPGNVLVVAPHHNIGDDPAAEFRHHGTAQSLPSSASAGSRARS